MDCCTVLLCSVEQEAEQLRDWMRHPAERVMGRRKVLFGELASIDVLLAVCGAGKVNAAQMLTAILEQVCAERVVLFGCAGAYPDAGLGVGSVAIATREVYGDEGMLTKEGFFTLDAMDLPAVSTPEKVYYNEFELDPGLTSLAERVLLEEGCEPVLGTFVTVSCCSGTRQRGELLRRRFDGVCENMEGAAVAHMCALYDIPLLELRGISNLVVDRDLQDWDLPLAALQSQQAVLRILKQL